MKEKKIDSMIVRLLQGNITTCNVDAIIINASPELLMESEIAESVKNAGGDAIESQAIRHAPVQPGGVILTTGGGLQARYVIHAVSKEEENQTNPEDLENILDNILELVTLHKFEDIAIPPIGTRLGGFPIESCANIMLQKLVSFAQQPCCTLKRVVFVLQNQKSYKIFEQTLEQI